MVKYRKTYWIAPLWLGVDMAQGYHLDKPCKEHPALTLSFENTEFKSA